MFEVGAQLNTSCLKKTDARVEQEMRERPERERGERGLEEASMRKYMRRQCEKYVEEAWGDIARRENRWRQTERRPPVVQGGCCSKDYIRS